MTQDEIKNTIMKIEEDIFYFTNISFPTLANRFKRDLELINYLISKQSDNL